MTTPTTFEHDAMSNLMPVAAIPSNSSTPGLPSAAVAYAAAAAASLSNNQSQSLLALSTTQPKGHVASESSTAPVTLAQSAATTTNVATSLSPNAGSPHANSPIATNNNGSLSNEDQTASETVGEENHPQSELENDSNNNNLYTLPGGKGGDDHNNNQTTTTVASSPPLPVEVHKPRELTSPQISQHSIPLPSTSQSPLLVYSSYGYTPVSHQLTLATPSHSSAHATQSYAMPIPASGMYAHHNGALLGHSPQHMFADPAAAMMAKEAAQKNYAMKMVSQSLSGKPLTVAYPPQFAAHMAQMQKQMMGQSANSAAHAAAAQQQQQQHHHHQQQQQNVAQLAAAYAAQYQQHANAVAASTAQTGVSGGHQLTPQHRYSASTLNGQASLLTAGQTAGVSATPQLFPGYARAPAPPQPMFMQPPHLMRPQMPGQPGAQFYPGNLFYPGYPQVAPGAAGMGPAGMPSPLAAATAASAGVSPNMHAIQAVQQAQSANATATAGAALGLNPYKKMKTS